MKKLKKIVLFHSIISEKTYNLNVKMMYVNLSIHFNRNSERKRSKSVESKRVTFGNKQLPDSINAQDLLLFKRSLRLLGIEVEGESCNVNKSLTPHR